MSLSHTSGIQGKFYFTNSVNETDFIQKSQKDDTINVHLHVEFRLTDVSTRSFFVSKEKLLHTISIYQTACSILTARQNFTTMKVSLLTQDKLEHCLHMK